MQINTIDSISQIKKFCCENFTDKNHDFLVKLFKYLNKREVSYKNLVE